MNKPKSEERLTIPGNGTVRGARECSRNVVPMDRPTDQPRDRLQTQRQSPMVRSLVLGVSADRLSYVALIGGKELFQLFMFSTQTLTLSSVYVTSLDSSVYVRALCVCVCV